LGLVNIVMYWIRIDRLYLHAWSFSNDTFIRISELGSPSDMFLRYCKRPLRMFTRANYLPSAETCLKQTPFCTKSPFSFDTSDETVTDGLDVASCIDGLYPSLFRCAVDLPSSSDWPTRGLLFPCGRRSSHWRSSVLRNSRARMLHTVGTVALPRASPAIADGGGETSIYSVGYDVEAAAVGGAVEEQIQDDWAADADGRRAFLKNGRVHAERWHLCVSVIE
jgi:hypothetical protein